MTRRAGYRKLSAFRAEDIIEVHDQAARIGETWSYEIREAGSVEYLAGRIRVLAAKRYSPWEIASIAMHFVVSEHPFWDANHRGGFELAQMILRAFGFKISASKEEAEAFVRSIDEQRLQESVVRTWVKKWITKLR